MTQPTLINLHPNKYGQQFHYYPFSVKLDRCVGSHNALNNLSNKVCVPYKTKLLIQRIQRDYRNKWNYESIYHANVHVDLMKENVIHINGGIMISMWV